MFGLFVILHIVDLILTFYGISIYGFWIEGNDFVRELFINNLSYLWILSKCFLYLFLFFVIKFYLKVGNGEFKNKKSKIVYNAGFIGIVVLLSYIIFNILVICINWVKVLI